MKFYGVKVGYRTGVFDSWAETQRAVQGCKNAQFRKFDNIKDAMAFVYGDRKKTHERGWTEESDHGITKPVETLNYGKTGPAEIVKRLRTEPIEIIKPVKTNPTERTRRVKTEPVEIIEPPRNETTKIIKPARIELTEATPSSKIEPVLNFCKCVCTCGAYPQVPLSSIALASGVATIEILKRRADVAHEQEPENKFRRTCSQSLSGDAQSEVTTTDRGPVHVYTDGACSSNGGINSCGGIGVYWGPNHPMNVSERLHGRQTNNRAEIMAAVKALKQAKSAGYKDIVLHTDSQFLIKGINQWIYKWKRNGWKLVDGGDVINRDDFEALDEAQKGLAVEFKYVKGHSGIQGNEEADRLAVKALTDKK